MCSSLILSILKQVLDDKDESVRECAVKNLSLLITRIYNIHKSSDVSLSISYFHHLATSRKFHFRKFWHLNFRHLAIHIELPTSSIPLPSAMLPPLLHHFQLLDILKSTLHDNSSKVQQTSLRFYLPSLSCWLLSRGQYLQTCYNLLLQQLLSSIQSNSARQTAIYLQSLTVSSVFVLAGLLRPLISDVQGETMSESMDESHLGLLDPGVILCISKSQYKSALSNFNTSLVQQSLPENVQTQTDWFKSTAVSCLVECIKSVKDKTLLADFTKLLAHMQTVPGRTFVQHVVRPGLLEHVTDARVLPVYCAGILAVNEEDRAELKEFLGDTLNQYAQQYLQVEPLTETFAELSQSRAVLHILVNVLNTALREATNPHMKGIIAKICKVSLKGQCA